jgi:hypothetical protein
MAHTIAGARIDYGVVIDLEALEINSEETEKMGERKRS